MTAVVLPGGMPGDAQPEKVPPLWEASVNYCYENGLMIAAICAARPFWGSWVF